MVPSVTLTLPPLRTPSVKSDVPLVSGTVPVPLAGVAGGGGALGGVEALAVPDEPEEEEEPVELAGNAEPPPAA